MRRISMIRSYYEMSRQGWPELGRLRSLRDAWRCWKRVSS